MHAGIYVVGKAVEEAVRTQTVEACMGAPLRVDNWEVTIESIKEVKYIKSGGSFYSSKEPMKIIMIKLKVRNIGEEVSSASDI